MFVPDQHTPCMDADPDIFFEPDRVAEAQAICATCPLIDWCRLAGESEEYGVWGGVVSIGMRDDVREAKRANRTSRADYVQPVMALYDSGVTSYVEIARQLGIGHTTVRQIVRAQRPNTLSQQDKSRELTRQVKALRAEGHDVIDIASRLDISTAAVYRRLSAAA